MVLHGDLQNVLECCLQIRVVRPGVHVDAADLLRQSLTLQHLDPGRSGEGHEHVVVRTGVALGKVHRQADRSRHRSSVHGTGSIRNDQCIGPCFHVVRQLAPLGFQRIVFRDPDPSPIHLHDLFDDVVRKQSSRMNGLLTACSLLYELAKTIRIVLHESISVDHHGSGRNRRVADLIPASRGHEGFDDTDLLTHRTHQTLKLVYGVSELLCGQDTESSGICGRSIRCLDPLCKQGNSISRHKVLTVLFELSLHSRPHLVLQRCSDQAVQVIKAAVHTDQVQVRTQGFRMVLCHKLQKRTEGLSFTQSASDITRVERDLRCEQRIRLVGLGEKTGDPLLVRAAE